MKKSIILIGGGGHCRSCIDVIEREERFTIEGIVDLPQKKGEMVLGYPIIADDSEISDLCKNYQNFLITLGHLHSPLKRMEIFKLLKTYHIILPTIVSPYSYVSKHANVGEGTIVLHHALVNANASIGNNCIINSRALVEHDVQIGSHCHISTGAIVNGGVQIGEGTFYGSGAVSQEYSNIPSNSFIKANSIVKK